IFLFEQRPDGIPAALEMKYELFGSSVAISRDGHVDITGRARLCAGRDGEATNECTRHTGVVELRKNALERALDGVQRRGHVAGIPTPSPSSAPGRRAYQAPTRSSNTWSDIPGDSRRSRCRSMRSATSISANAMRSFSLGVSRPVSDMRQGYHGFDVGRARKRDTNRARQPRNRAFVDNVVPKTTPPKPKVCGSSPLGRAD